MPILLKRFFLLLTLTAQISYTYVEAQTLSSYEIASKLLLLEMEIERASYLYTKLYPIYENTLYAEILEKINDSSDNSICKIINSTLKKHRSTLLNQIEKYLGNRYSSHKQIPYFKYIENKTGKFPAMVHFELKTACWSPEWVNAWNKLMNSSFNQSIAGTSQIINENMLKNIVLKFRKSYKKELRNFQKQDAYLHTLLGLNQAIVKELKKVDN